MDYLETLLSPETLAKVKEEIGDKPIKLVDLTSGKYVDKDKHESTVKTINDNYNKLVMTHEEYKNNNSSDKYKELETKYNELNKELSGAKNKTLLTNKNVNEDYLDFVDFNVSQMVNDELTYEQALETFAKDNERYFQKSKTVSTQHQTKNDKIDVASFNDVIRSNFNKK